MTLEGGTPEEGAGSEVFKDPITGSEVQLPQDPVQEQAPDLLAEAGIDPESLSEGEMERAKRMQAVLTRSSTDLSLKRKEYEEAMGYMSPLMEQALASRDPTNHQAETPAEEPPGVDSLVSEGEIDPAALEKFIKNRVDSELEVQVGPEKARLQKLEVQAQVNQWETMLSKYPSLKKTWTSKVFLNTAQEFSRRNPEATVQDIFNATAMPIITGAYQRHLARLNNRPGPGLETSSPSITRRQQAESGKKSFADHLFEARQEAEE